VNEFSRKAQWFGGLFNWTRPAAFREWPFDFGNTGTVAQRMECGIGGLLNPEPSAMPQD
jgi:hypothetical protein